MSQGNVELTYQVIDALNRRDLDAALALVDDYVEYVSLLAPMEGGHGGHDGIRRFWESLFAVWPDLIAELLEVCDVGDVTVGAVRLRGHGAGSEIPSDWTVWQVGRWRRGMCVSVQSFETRDEALEAVGLSE